MNRRVQYSCIRDGAHCFVIAEMDATGRVEFVMQESGEARWYPFQPSDEEANAALRLMTNPASTQWIHLDLPGPPTVGQAHGLRRPHGPPPSPSAGPGDAD